MSNRKTRENEAINSSFSDYLFEKGEKDDEKFYKKNLFILKEDIDTKKENTVNSFKHDALVNKLLLHDFSIYPPKLNTDDVQIKENDDQKILPPERYTQEENEFLKELHRINYMTFSPFALEFFENSIIQNNNKVSENLFDQNANNFEKEKKMLDILDFDYDKYDFNKYLLLNICNGFIDIEKLKERNMINYKKENNLNSSPDKTQENLSGMDDSELYSRKSDVESITDVKDIIGESDYDFDNDSLNEKMTAFIKRNSNIEFFRSQIEKYNEEKKNIANLKGKVKRDFKKKWEARLKEIEDVYKKYRIQINKSESVRKIKEEKKQKEVMRETLKKEREEKEYEEKLRKIQQNGRKAKKQKNKNKSVDNDKNNRNKIKDEGRFNWMVKKSDNYFNDF